MPRITIVFYADDDGSAPVLASLEEIKPKARDKCRIRIERLRDLGHELRRPESDYLRDKIYELRVGLNHVNYRILYFLHGSTAAILAVALAKEAEIPPKEIDRAIEKKRKFEANPKKHTYNG